MAPYYDNWKKDNEGKWKDKTRTCQACNKIHNCSILGAMQHCPEWEAPRTHLLQLWDDSILPVKTFRTWWATATVEDKNLLFRMAIPQSLWDIWKPLEPPSTRIEKVRKIRNIMRKDLPPLIASAPNCTPVAEFKKKTDAWGQLGFAPEDKINIITSLC